MLIIMKLLTVTVMVMISVVLMMVVVDGGDMTMMTVIGGVHG